LNAGERCDAMVLTASMIADLEVSGRVLRGSGAPLGRVRTGIAVKEAARLPRIADRVELTAAFRAATALYVPDIERSTAGMQVAKVLKRLGIFDEVAPRLSVHPNGATAMRAMAAAGLPGAVGCTQITEIRYTRGVTLVGPLPAEFELATVYSVAVAADARDPALARRFAELIAGAEALPLRRDAGFE
jgi:molybdate transport system substrate-binding protein